MLSLIEEHIEYKQAFGHSLKIIKLWAKRRGLYGFNFGYLNGISLTIMLIKALQYLARDSQKLGIKKSANQSLATQRDLIEPKLSGSILQES